MIEVDDNGDGSFTIKWDENDPDESIFNDFTQQDFIDLLTSYAALVLEEEEENT